jgi:hypothetical protein
MAHRYRTPGLQIDREHPVYRVWRPEWDALLGAMSDYRLARQLGVSPLTVMAHRRAADVPPYYRRRTWTPADDKLLRTMPDRALAERLGCGLQAVVCRRRKLGVPAHRKYERKGVTACGQKSAGSPGVRGGVAPLPE